jgi:AGCS family alanine or glycine:cation symporter
MIPGTQINIIHLIIGVGLLVVGALIIIGGLQRIAKVAEIVVPFMATLFVAGSLVIFCINIDQVGAMFTAIFKFAFQPAAFLGGGVGILVKKTMTQGFKRGVFSNEAGLGSSVLVHSSSNTKEPVKQGMWGIFEVFFDTFVVCTMTAVVVLSTGYIDLATGTPVAGANGDTLVSQAFGNVFGAPGTWFIAIAMLFFAFTTVLGWSQYGSKAVEYLFGTKGVKVYKFIFVAMIVCGAVMEGGLAWELSDTFNGLMMIPNLIGVISLLPLVLKITKNYVDRKIAGKDVAPILSYDAALQKEMELSLDEEN